jgi:hypothetical protein
MLLTLQNGYPFPYPTDLSDAEQDDIADEAAGYSVDIPGVVHFEWKHTVTVEFDGLLSANAARDATGWETWGNDPKILEAKTSAADGYGHPAIIIGPTAYCGFMLSLEEPPEVLAKWPFADAK